MLKSIAVTSVLPALLAVTVLIVNVSALAALNFAPRMSKPLPATVEVISTEVVSAGSIEAKTFFKSALALMASFSATADNAAVVPPAADTETPLIMTVCVSAAAVVPPTLTLETCATAPPLSKPKLAADKSSLLESNHTDMLRPSELRVTP